MAPEVLEGNYNDKCDSWSMGVLLYVFMSGYLPFQGANRSEVFKKIRDCNFHFKHVEFNTVSDTAKDLIRKLLVKDLKKRLSPAQALNHPWFKETMKQDMHKTPIGSQALQRLAGFKAGSKLKQAAMGMLVKMSDAQEIE